MSDISFKYNPFKPGSVVHSRLFVGRESEQKLIQRCLLQTRNGNPQNFLIQGERGIGKSSLVFHARHLGQQPDVNFAVLHVDLNPSYSFIDIMERLISEAQMALEQLDPVEEVKKVLEFLSGFKSKLLSYEPKTKVMSPALIINQLAELLQRVGRLNIIAGILILVDEADKPDSQAHLGTLFKLLTERLVFMNCNNVCLGLAGLPETIDKLRDSHESSLRIFHILKLSTLSSNDCYAAIDLGLDEANQKNKFNTTISKEAKKQIVQQSEGYPYFLQQFAYNAFEVDTDRHIDVQDVEKGLFDPQGGALQQLGEKLFNNLFYNQIQSEDYRRVLQYMAKNSQLEWVSRSNLLDDLKQKGVKETTINNALKALRERKIICSDSSQKGHYKMPSKSFAIWINAFTKFKNGHLG